MSEETNVATTEAKVITIQNASCPAEWRRLVHDASNKVSVAIAEGKSKTEIAELREKVYEIKTARGKHQFGYENPPAVV